MKYKWPSILVNFCLIQLFVSFHITQAEQIDWVTTFGGIKNEHISHVLVCPNNDIIVIGTFSDSLIFKSDSNNLDTLICENKYEDVFIAKFRSHGHFLWATSLSHGLRSFDWWLHPSVDQEGNLLLGGTFIGEILIGKDSANGIHFISPEINSLDIFLTRILDDGQIDWAIKLGDEDQEQLWDIDTDDEGSVYLTGRFWKNSIFLPGGMNDDIILTSDGSSFSIFNVKYDKNGNLYWADKILNEYDMLGHSIAVSKSGKVSIAGYFSESIILSSELNSDTLYSKGLTDIFVATYDTNGNYLWSISEGGSAYDMANDLEYDNQENVIVTGSFQGIMIMDSRDTLRSDNSIFEEYDDIFIAKYNSGGNYLWSDAAGGGLLDRGERIQIFKNDKILLSGFYWNEATFSKGKKNSKTISNIADTSSHFAAKYTSDGILYWVADVDSLFQTFNTNLAIDSTENMIRAGEYYGDIDLQSEENSIPVSSNGGSDIYLARFISNITSIPENGKVMSNFILYQNYPNPFNPRTTISYTLPTASDVRLSIYDILGQKIKTIVGKRQTAGTYEIRWDGRNEKAENVASGIYLYSLKVNEHIITKKMVLLR